MPQHDLLVQSILDNNDISSLQEPALHEQLSALINDLILNNFDGLVYILYRVDVSEYKLKTLLKENDKTDAGGMIATLIIERQVQKIRSRQEHARDKKSIDDEESW